MRWKRIALVALVLLVIALAVATWFFPFLLKRYIERNSEAWIDRKVTIGSIVLNPFSGVYAVHGFTSYEPRSEQVFVSFSKLGVKGDVVHGLRTGEWRFREAELRDPYFHVVQQGDRFNFSDLLELGGPAAEKEEPASSSEVKFFVEGIEISGGRIDYVSDLLREPVRVLDLSVGCTRITSANARMEFRVGLGLEDGTRLDGGFMIDTDVERYAVEAHLRQFDLARSLPYLQDFFEAGSLGGLLDVDLNVEQSYTDSSDLALSARMDMRGLALRDRDGEHLLDLRQLRAELDTLVGSRMEVGVVDIVGLDARFALLADGTDNWTRLLKLVPDSTAGEAGAMVLDASASNYYLLLAEYVSYLGSAVSASAYSADSLVLREGRLRFEDLTLPRPFRYDITDIDLRAQRFSDRSEAAPISARAVLDQAGTLRASALFDPKDPRNVELVVDVDSLMLPKLDPYVRWYAAHPMADGILAFASRTTIRDGMIDSRNNLRVDRLRFGKKIDEHDPGIIVLPLRLAAGLLKDVRGVVELDVPVKGDLRDPQFRVWPIVWLVLKNLVVKAAAAPVKLLARAFEGADEKDLEQVRFVALQVSPQSAQRRALHQLAKALEAKPGLSVDLVPVADSLAEAGELAVFKAKARHLFPGVEALSAADTVAVRSLATLDSAFVRWMDAQLPGTGELPMTERGIRLLGKDVVTREWQELERARRAQVMAALLEAGADAQRVRFRQGSSSEVAAFRGAPGYRFIYDVADPP
ncbi:MAG: DUF748 domain-containing protein [Flavobacteriales bacterium]|nr:DUF748 domain-containing protein [Flavobacteriales bacterium]